MPRLFLIRHGETDWNRQRKLQGHTDIPLNDLGRAQAESLRSLITDLRFDEVLASDLQRARRTGEICLPGTALNTTPLLRETFLGQAEGLTREEILAKWPELWLAWSDLHWAHFDAAFPGGESRRQGLQRLFRLLTEQRASFSQDRKIGYFTHGLLLRTFAQWAQGSQEAQFTTPNCCVYEWEWQWCELHFDSPVEARPRLRQIHLLPEGSLSL